MTGKVNGWLRARHMRDLFSVEIGEEGGLPTLTYAFNEGGISGDVVELVELLGPAVFQYLVNIEKARTPQHDARNVLVAYGRIWQGIVFPPLVRQDVEVEQSYSSNSTTSPTFRRWLTVGWSPAKRRAWPG